MSELAKVGEFCPNPDCPDYGQVGTGQIIRYGKTAAGRQRFWCHTCDTTFSERKDTLFYNRKTEEEDIIRCLAMLAEGVRIRSIGRIMGMKPDTIVSFLREAAAHAHQVEAILLNEYAISQAQIDGLWTYVARKEKKMRPTTKAEHTGDAP
jgi:transposase-like protein